MSAELRDERAEQAGENIAGTAFGQGRIAGSVDEDFALRARDDGVKAFQDDNGVPFFGGVGSGLDAIVLYLWNRDCRGDAPFLRDAA